MTVYHGLVSTPPDKAVENFDLPVDIDALIRRRCNIFSSEDVIIILYRPWTLSQLPDVHRRGKQLHVAVGSCLEGDSSVVYVRRQRH